MAGSTVPDIGQRGTPLSMGDHIIIVYGSQPQRWNVLTPFLAAGLSLRQQVVAIAPDTTVPEARRRLEEVNIDVARALAAGQLVFVGRDELPVQPHAFDDQRMMEYLRRGVEAARADGWLALRVAAEMPWFVNEADFAGLLRFEAAVNREFRQRSAVMMCLYDMTEMQPGAVTDLVSTHPLVVLGDRVVENDLYVPDQLQDGTVGERLH